jgi:MFS family permease
MIEMLNTRLSLRFVTILPILGFALSSYYLINFIFYLKYIHIPAFLSFILIGAPFIGRAITPITYSLLVSRIGISRVIYSSIGSMAIINILEYTDNNFSFLLMLRIITGILFGLSTSASIELASESKSKIIIGMTMGGWALGWITAAFSAFLLGKYMLLIGIFPSTLLIFYWKSKIDGNKVLHRQIKIEFSWKALLIFLLGFEPAYILQILPSLIGQSAAICETFISYSLSFLAYAFLPLIKNVKMSSILISIVIGISGFFAFISLKIYLFILFTIFGLGMNSILPILSRFLNVDPRKIGPSMNLAALSGFMIPIFVEIGNIKYNSALLTLTTSVLLISFILYETNKKVLNKI